MMRRQVFNVHLLALVLISFALFNARGADGGWFNRDPSYTLQCYRGAKVMIGHDPREETVQCKSMLGLVKPYCYRFIAHTPVHDMVKLGCATVMCSSIRNTCAEYSFGGVAGTLCCCNDLSFCNSASRLFGSFTLPFALAGMLLALRLPLLAV